MIIVKRIEEGKKIVVKRIHEKGDTFVIGYFCFMMGCLITYYHEPMINLFR
jgi:hypothetical protein